MAYRGQGGLRPNSQCTKREPPNVSSWHTASIRCGAKGRTRSERSGHAESVGKRGDSTTQNSNPRFTSDSACCEWSRRRAYIAVLAKSLWYENVLGNQGVRPNPRSSAQRFVKRHF